MENQTAKRQKACPNSGDGRISELPQPLLHNILAFLSQEEATRTCVLSKSWRSIGPTRPKIEFNETWNEEKHEKFLSNLDSTLQVYRGRKICLQEFILRVRKINAKSVSLLKKWVPIVLLDMGVKRFHLISISSYFDLPSIVFEAETLEDLHLKNCRIESVENRLHLAVNGPTKAAIDLPNILSFELLCDDFPSITLTTNSSEWRSLILLKRELITKSETALLFVKLNELLRALNHSRIHLHMRDFPLEVPHGCGGFGEPAVIECLAFSHRHPCSSLEAFLNYFFGSFRPRYIEESFYPRSESEEYEDNMDAYYAYEEEHLRFTEWYAAARAAQVHGLEDEYMELPAYPGTNPYGEPNELIDRMWIFLMKKEREDRIWQQDLEEVSVETYGQNGVEWRCVQSENLSQLALPDNDDQKMRFQLKWRE
ncbi:Unknown protein [Striga hermonthica]|uniref:F-box domain-containing protein n=1 Tax=Striga hermonthica TaxID=68872 RepID=A0A9N7NNZ0_STRHE|nr:Unknown protein [Striga hermonthica]